LLKNDSKVLWQNSSLQTLRNESQFSKEGVSLSGISEAVFYNGVPIAWCLQYWWFKLFSCWIGSSRKTAWMPMLLPVANGSLPGKVITAFTDFKREAK
jgi:hypothetical protein